MRKYLSALLLASVALASAAPAVGPKFSTSGGVGSADSTFSGGEPTGGTYTINGTTGRVSAPIVNLRPGSAPVSPQNGDCWTTIAGLFCRINDATVGPYQSSAGAGTVTQVGLVPPSIFTAGGAVTTSGNLSFTLNSQAANQVFAGPNGSSGTPGFRALVGADVPAINMAGSGNGGVTGTLGLANGGLGATTAAEGRSTLGLGTAAVQNTGTSGGNVPLLSGANTWGDTQTFSRFVFTGSGVSTADVGLKHGSSRTGDGYTYIDLISTAGSSFDARLIRNPGANGSFDITQTGTSPMYLVAPGGINALNPVTAPYFKPATAECANILHFGGDRTGASFSDTAFDNAVSASQSAKICVYLPSGTYKFNTTKYLTLAASPAVGSITVKGDGPDVTNLNFASGTTGLGITTNGPYQGFHISNLSILGGTFNTSTVGISAYGAVDTSNPAINAPSSITNVTVRGNDGYSATNGFGAAIRLNAMSNVNMSNVQMYGPGDVLTYNSTCLDLVGRTASNGVVFNVARSGFLTCRQGLVYGSSVEGVNVTQSNFVGNLVGIIVPTGSSDGSQLAAVGNHFNAYATGIDIEVDPGGVTIADNYFIINTQESAANGIINKATQDYSITGNVFARQGTGTANAIVIGAYNTHSGIISGNTFQNIATAITLQSGSQRATVGVNSFAPSVTTKVTNSGTNNIVAATCSGAPTAGFTVTNGVITAC